MNLPSLILNSVAAAALAGSAFGQTTTTITFDEAAQGFEHGTLFSGSEYSTAANGGATFTVKSFGKNDQGLIFDTNTPQYRDPDLNAPFLGGNLKGRTDLGNALIIAENLKDRNDDGLVDNPDDEALGGNIQVVFGADNVSAVGFNLYDTPENTRSDVSVTFTATDGGVIVWDVNDLLGFSNDVAFANHYANAFEGITADSLGLTSIKSIDFKIESGAIDNVSYTTPDVIPEPSSTALLGLGALTLICRRQRGKKR